jgi:hypothetical protein
VTTWKSLSRVSPFYRVCACVRARVPSLWRKGKSFPNKRERGERKRVDGLEEEERERERESAVMVVYY